MRAGALKKNAALETQTAYQNRLAGKLNIFETCGELQDTINPTKPPGCNFRRRSPFGTKEAV